MSDPFLYLPLLVLLLAAGLVAAAIARDFWNALRSAAERDPPESQWRVRVAVALVVVGVGWGLYRLEHPSERFFRATFEEATGSPLPADARLVARCSSWYDTAAVYEIPDDEWEAFRTGLAHYGKEGAILPDAQCDPMVQDALGGPPDTSATVMIDWNQLIWSTNRERRRIFWQVTVD